jgi:hypothetical protein
MAMFPTNRSHSYVRKQRLQYDWSFRGIKWGALLRYQHWGGLLLFIPAAIIAGRVPCDLLAGPRMVDVVVRTFAQK